MALQPETIERIEVSFEALAPHGEQIVSRFYENLFEAAPQVRAMFPDDLTAQKRKLLAAIAMVVANVRHPDELRPALLELGARHVKYGAEESHYPVVRDALLAALQDAAGELWTPEIRAAWVDALNLVTSTMIEGAREAEARGGEVRRVA